MHNKIIYIIFDIIKLNKMKREIKIIPLVLSILGFVAVGLCLGSLYEVATTFELWFGVVFGFIAFTFILLLSIGFPLTKEERKQTEIKL